MKAFRIVLSTSDYPILVIANDIKDAINKVILNTSKVAIDKIEELKEFTSENIIV